MEAPKLPSLFGFRAKKPDRFYFEPRYYDERKEKMKQRYERVEREFQNNNQSSSTQARYEPNLREQWGNSYSRSKVGTQMNRRVILYLIVLLALAYYILS